MKNLSCYFRKFVRRASQISLATTVVAAISFQGSVAHADQVIDEETGKPLEGVFVMVSWRSHGPSVVINKTVCYAFETIRTDKNGQFEMPKFSWNFNPLHWDRNRSVELYLAGYERSPNDFHDSDVAKMRRFKGTVEDRLKKLISVGYRHSCVPEAQAKEKLAPLYKAQVEEAINIAVSTSDKKIVQSLRLLHFESEMGHEAFMKMYTSGQIK